MQLEFRATGQDLTRLDHNHPRANSQDYLTAKFIFPAEYDGTITAHFRMMINSSWYETSATVIDGICNIPDDIVKDGNLYIGITGTGTKHIPTEYKIVPILPSCDDDNMYPLPGQTTSQYQETVTMYDEIKTMYESGGGSGSGGSTVTDSTANGNILVNGAEVNVYTHPTGTNPHGTTKTDVGLSNAEDKSSATIRGEITSQNVTNALGYTPLNTYQKGSISGVAELDSNGKVPSSQLPSYVDDVIEGTLATFPTTGEAGKIYVDTVSGKTYRWSGSTYTEISASLALGENSTTAYRGDRGKTAYDHSQLTSGNPHGITKSDVGLGNVVNLDTSTTSNITGSLDKRFVTDTEKAKIANAITDISAKLEAVNIKQGTNVAVSVSGNDVTINASGFINQRTSASLLLWAGSQAQYTALGTYDSNTVYLISG